MQLIPRNWLTTRRREPLVRLLPYLILLIAFGLRLHRIEVQSFWNDEGNTVRLIQRDPGALIAAASADIHPPGYYLLLRAWSSVTGDTEFSLRLFSAFSGLLTVACIFALGGQLAARGVGWLAAAFVTVNTFSIYYGQEARMYAPVAFVGAFSTLCFILWIKALTVRSGTIKRRLWQSGLLFGILFAALNAVGLYLHYTYPLVMLAQGALALLWIALQRRSRHIMQPMLIRYIVLNGVTLLLFVPQLPTALRQVTAWPNTGGAVDLGTGISTVAQWLIFGNTALNVPIWIYGVCALFAVVSLLPDWLRRPYRMTWRVAVPWVVLLVMLIPFFAFGLYRPANLKFLLPAQWAIALILARGGWYLYEIGSGSILVFSEALPRLVGTLGVFYVFTVFPDAINNLYYRAEFARPDYRAMANVVATLQTPDSAIILDAPNQLETFSLYYQGAAPIFPLPRGLGGDDTATRAETEQIIARYARIFVLYWGETERDPNRTVEKTLTESTYEVASNWFGDVRLVQYSVLRGTFTPVTLPATGAEIGAETRFGDHIRLLEARLNGTQFRSGDVLGIALRWTTDAELTTRYKIFVQLLNAQGQLVTQRDAEPGNNLILTTTWLPNTSVDDAHGLLIPPTTPDGTYTVIIGLYDLNDPAARLIVNNVINSDISSDPSGDPALTYVTLATITVATVDPTP